MLEIVKAWEQHHQVTFAVVTVVTAGVVCLFVGCSLSYTLRVIFRGYQPQVPDRPECNHDDNLTGQCLKPAGCCKTRDECDNLVASAASRGPRRHADGD